MDHLDIGFFFWPYHLCVFCIYLIWQGNRGSLLPKIFQYIWILSFMCRVGFTEVISSDLFKSWCHSHFCRLPSVETRSNPAKLGPWLVRADRQSWHTHWDWAVVHPGPPSTPDMTWDMAPLWRTTLWPAVSHIQRSTKHLQISPAHPIKTYTLKICTIYKSLYKSLWFNTNSCAEAHCHLTSCYICKCLWIVPWLFPVSPSRPHSVLSTDVYHVRHVRQLDQLKQRQLAPRPNTSCWPHKVLCRGHYPEISHSSNASNASSCKMEHIEVKQFKHRGHIMSYQVISCWYRDVFDLLFFI